MTQLFAWQRGSSVTRGWTKKPGRFLGPRPSRRTTKNSTEVQN